MNPKDDLLKMNVPEIGRVPIVPPYVIDTPDGKRWGAPQMVTLGFVNQNGDFVTIDNVCGTIIEEICNRLPEILGKILSPPNGKS
jgi:hypothetical protein